jgi:hypothetical protein
MTLGRGPIGSLPNTLRKWLVDDAYCARRFEADYCYRTEVDLAEGIRREAEWCRGRARKAA